MTDWPGDETDFDGLTMERSVHPDETSGERAQRLFAENADMAAMSIIQLAMASKNERVRFSAATYVVDRALGRAPNAPNDSKAPWEKLLAGSIVDVEDYANRRD